MFGICYGNSVRVLEGRRGARCEAEVRAGIFLSVTWRSRLGLCQFRVGESRRTADLSGFRAERRPPKRSPVTRLRERGRGDGTERFPAPSGAERTFAAVHRSVSMNWPVQFGDNGGFPHRGLPAITAARVTFHFLPSATDFAGSCNRHGFNLSFSQGVIKIITNFAGSLCFITRFIIHKLPRSGRNVGGREQIPLDADGKITRAEEVDGACWTHSIPPVNLRSNSVNKIDRESLR